jgi:prefoldin alpha subunit
MNNEKIELINNLNSRYETIVEQLKIIEQQISELSTFEEELGTIKEKSSQDMLVQIGKSVFAPVKIDHSSKLLVDVGAGYFINKNIDEVKLIVLEQKKRLESFKLQMSPELDKITQELQSIIY